MVFLKFPSLSLLLPLVCWAYCWKKIKLVDIPVSSLTSLRFLQSLFHLWWYCLLISYIEMLFKKSIEMIIWIFSFCPFMWFITFIDLFILNHHFTSRMNSIWSWWITFLIHVWIIVYWVFFFSLSSLGKRSIVFFYFLSLFW